MSHWQPGYVFAHQVPPTSASRSQTTKSSMPSCLRRIAMPRPANPAPTMPTLTWRGSVAGAVVSVSGSAVAVMGYASIVETLLFPEAYSVARDAIARPATRQTRRPPGSRPELPARPHARSDGRGRGREGLRRRGGRRRDRARGRVAQDVLRALREQGGVLPRRLRRRGRPHARRHRRGDPRGCAGRPGGDRARRHRQVPGDARGEPGVRAHVPDRGARGGPARAGAPRRGACALRRPARHDPPRGASQRLRPRAARGAGASASGPGAHVFRACVGATHELVTAHVLRRGAETLPELLEPLVEVEQSLLLRAAESTP